MPEERLQKLLAQAGIASRRASEDLIRQGRVTVNGVKATVGTKVDTAEDTIRVDGELVRFSAEATVYIMLNKPKGIVSAASAQRQEERQTVLDLVNVVERVYPVGRLDADSEGLILLTNDGELTQRLTHPRYGHQKTYRVLVKGTPTQDQVDSWAAGGILLDDGPTAPCTVTIENAVEAGTWLEITMGEGRKRQIRRTAVRLGLHVMRLIRTRMGSLRLSGVKPGEWRFLTAEEVTALKEEAASIPLARKPRRRIATPRAATGKPAGSPARKEDRPAESGGRPAARKRRPIRSEWQSNPDEAPTPAAGKDKGKRRSPTRTRTAEEGERPAAQDRPEKGKRRSPTRARTAEEGERPAAQDRPGKGKRRSPAGGISGGRGKGSTGPSRKPTGGKPTRPAARRDTSKGKRGG